MTESDALIGQRISHYRIIEKLGGGGMGVVYKAEDSELGRFVALKFLPEDLAKDPQSLERFRREARAASALNHPHTQRGLSTATSSPRTSSSRKEATPRFSISAWQRSTRRKAPRVTWTPSPLLEWILTNSPLRAARRTSAPFTKLVSRMEGASSPWSIWRAKLSLGTVAYMSPEQVRGKESDARTDLFSFGVVLYEMATGALPFRGETSAVIFNAIMEKSPIPVTRLNPEISPRLEEIINKALEKDAEVRYQHPSELRADLKRLHRDVTSGHTIAHAAPATDGTGKSKSMHWVWGTAAVVALATVVFAGRFYFSAPPKYAGPAPRLVPFTSYPGDKVIPRSPLMARNSLFPGKARIPKIRMCSTSMYSWLAPAHHSDLPEPLRAMEIRRGLLTGDMLRSAGERIPPLIT